MPITMNPKPEHRLIILTHTGMISDNEFNDFYWRFFHSDTFSNSMNLLIDLRETDSRPRSAVTLHQFAGFVRERLDELSICPKVAVVAPKSLSYGLARMYQSYSDSVPWEFVVFRAVDAALAWLDVPEDLVICGNEQVKQQPDR